MKMTERPTTCPLCGFTGDTPDRIYQHIQVGHRKSTLAHALLTATPAHEESGIVD